MQISETNITAGVIAGFFTCVGLVVKYLQTRERKEIAKARASAIEEERGRLKRDEDRHSFRRDDEESLPPMAREYLTELRQIRIERQQEIDRMKIRIDALEEEAKAFRQQLRQARTELDAARKEHLECERQRRVLIERLKERGT